MYILDYFNCKMWMSRTQERKHKQNMLCYNRQSSVLSGAFFIRTIADDVFPHQTKPIHTLLSRWTSKCSTSPSNDLTRWALTPPPSTLPRLLVIMIKSSLCCSDGPTHKHSAQAVNPLLISQLEVEHRDISSYTKMLISLVNKNFSYKLILNKFLGAVTDDC